MTNPGQTIVEPTPHAFYLRHPSDEYIDEVLIETTDGGARIHAVTVPRYKTSGMSGDEWRVNVAITFSVDGQEVWNTTVRCIDTMAMGLPRFFLDHGRAFPQTPATLRMLRKGHEVYRHDYPTAALAAMSFGWDRVYGELERLPRELDEGLCFQPGCSAPHVVEYRLKARYSRQEGFKQEIDRRMGDYRRRFCLRHAQRGDCGLEDADRNYEKIGEVGPEHARGFGADVRESAAVIIDAELHPDAGGEAN